MLDRTRADPVSDGERRRIGPFDCQFVPVTHSVPHAFATAYYTPAGTILHTGDFKLDLTPVDGRKTDLALPRRDRPARRRRAAAALGLHQRRATRLHAVRVDRGRGDARPVPRPPGSQVHRRLLRLAPPPRRAGRPRPRSASGRQIAFLGRSMAQNVTLAREMGLLDVPADRVIDIEDASRFAPGEVCIICTGSQGEPMSALVAHGRARAQVGEGQRGRHRRDLGPRHPGQRGERVPRHRRVPPHGRRGRPRRDVARARVGSCVTGRAQVHAEPDATGMVRPRARRVPAHGPPRPPGPRRRVGRRPRRRLRGRRRADARRRAAWTSTDGRCRPATSTSTASSATSATACSATGAASPRKALSS